MAITKQELPTFYNWLEKSSSILELGNQEFHTDTGFPNRSVKSYCENLGKIHISIDITGWDRSIPLDLTRDDLPELGLFDFITNYGTTEHINENQYNVFKNIHNWCKVGGVMLHSVPWVGNWPNHCNIYYTFEFFSKLTELNNYKIIELRPEYFNDNGNLIVAILEKQDNRLFTEDVLTFQEFIVKVEDVVKVEEYWKRYLK